MHCRNSDTNNSCIHNLKAAALGKRVGELGRILLSGGLLITESFRGSEGHHAYASRFRHGSQRPFRRPETFTIQPKILELAMRSTAKTNRVLNGKVSVHVRRSAD